MILIKDLIAKKVHTKMVPKNFISEQENWKNLHRYCIKSVGRTQTLEKIVTSNKTWASQYDPETKFQSPMEKFGISKTENGTNAKVKCQNNADVIF